MKKTKLLSLLTTIVYVTGCLICVTLLITIAFGTKVVPYPDAMIPYSLSAMAFITLGIGFIPMFLASLFYYKTHSFSSQNNPKLKLTLIFLLSGVCGLCFLVLVGFILYFIVIGLINHFSFVTSR